MKKKIKAVGLLVGIVGIFLGGLMSLNSTAYFSVGAEIEDNAMEQLNGVVCTDIKNGSSESCYQEQEVALLSANSRSSCITCCNTHGPGRESGGRTLLDAGCRNYMELGFTYGATDIPYWINMDSINQIGNSTHRARILSDIRAQAVMWNDAKMYDGTGLIVKIYEMSSSTKPADVDGKAVVEIRQGDLTSIGAAGLFSSSDVSITLDYDVANSKIGYNVDTVVHEFGHVLGLI